MAGSDYTIDINFAGDNVPLGPAGSSSDYMANVLTKLSNSIDKLVNTINKIEQKSQAQERPTSDAAMTQKAKEVLSVAAIAAAATTTVRWLSANANAVMANATNRGVFAGAGILGTANQSFSAYVGNYYDTERQREISINKAVGEGLGGFAGGVAGTAIGFATGNPLAIVKGAAGGATIGVGVGDYLSAKYLNAPIEERMLAEKALAERMASASTTEWQTGFSRFGLTRNPITIANSNITGKDPISVHLSDAFERKYGGDQNYNSILNNIAPYLQSSPMDNSNGNLSNVAENFLKAGFAASQFGQLTMQATQYQVLTGKNLEQFSNDLKSARAKFGDAYDIGSSQTSLNLMAMGYSQSQAESIAFQSKYNSGILGNTSQFTSLTPGGYYSTKALNKPLGFDYFNTLKTGQFQGSAAKRKQLQRDIQTAQNGGGLSPDLMILESQGISMGQISQWLQPAVKNFNGKNEKTEWSDAQTQAQNAIADALKSSLNSVDNMVVNAANVQIINNSGTMESLAQADFTVLSNINTPIHRAALQSAPVVWLQKEGHRAIKKL